MHRTIHKYFQKKNLVSVVDIIIYDKINIVFEL